MTNQKMIYIILGLLRACKLTYYAELEMRDNGSYYITAVCARDMGEGGNLDNFVLRGTVVNRAILLEGRMQKDFAEYEFDYHAIAKRFDAIVNAWIEGLHKEFSASLSDKKVDTNASTSSQDAYFGFLETQSNKERAKSWLDANKDIVTGKDSEGSSRLMWLVDAFFNTGRRQANKSDIERDGANFIYRDNDGEKVLGTRNIGNKFLAYLFEKYPNRKVTDTDNASTEINSEVSVNGANHVGEKINIIRDSLEITNSIGKPQPSTKREYHRDIANLEKALGYALTLSIEYNTPMVVHRANSHMHFLWNINFPNKFSMADISSHYNPKDDPKVYVVYPDRTAYEGKVVRTYSQEELEIEAKRKAEQEREDAKHQAISDLTNGIVTKEEIEDQDSKLEEFIDTIDYGYKPKYDSNGNYIGKEKLSREEIFKELYNEPDAIATLPVEYLQYFNGSTTDPRVYCSMAYFVDHATNHHPEVKPEEYKKIQDIITFLMKFVNFYKGELSQ